LDNCPSIIEWQAKIDEASRAFGKRMNVAGEQKEKLIAAGFEGVTDVVHKVPKDALHFLMLADFHLATFGAVAKRPKTERNRAL
jgi:hypothetical protein